MEKKIKKSQRLSLSILFAVCMGVILTGGIRYIRTLKSNLQDHAIQNVMTVTIQQQQAFDNFISTDQERMHSYAEYFSRSSCNSPEEIQERLTLFDDIDVIYSVMCLDEGWFCSNSSEAIRQVDEKKLDDYRNYTGSGVRSTYLGLFSGNPKFGFYEAFTFSDGHKGLLQKSYDRSKVSSTFSLSFYNNQGLAYVVNQDGDILLHPVDTISDQFYSNIFEVITEIHGQQTDIDSFIGLLRTRKSGTMIFAGDIKDYVYTYVPVESVEDWYLISIVPMDAITAETEDIILDSQIAMVFFTLILAICAIFVLFIRSAHKDIEYQSQLFNLFTTYLSQNTDDMYMMIDRETNKVEYLSPNMIRVLGVNAENVIDTLQDSDMAADPESARTYYEEIHDLSPGETAAPRRMERTNPETGEHKYFLKNVYCTSIQGKGKWIVYISDRTNERNTQNSLAEALQMARAANDAKSAFLSSVSHDIRTPMNAIIGFLTLMQEEVNNPQIMLEYIHRIDAASQHLLGLINDVLDMNKIESGSTTLSISEMDLAEVIEEINTIIRPQARAKNQAFDIFVSHMTYEHLFGDKLRINQILINLLSNAVKYTPENGTIEMRVEELPQLIDHRSRIRFTVKDNGLGMSQDYLKVIFDPFTREETKATHEIQGTGLGMAITNSLVNLMGGTIHVESEPGKGSTFTVELELRIQERDDDRKFWSDHHISRMIVADDDEQICHIIVRTMEKAGIHTDYSTDGGTAVLMMRSAREAGRPYDLILLDWMMPTLNGLETARLIRKNYSDRIPIVLLTAYDWDEIKEEAMEIGVDHFMPKPFFMSTFKEVIKRVTGNRKQKDSVPSSIVQGKHILVVDDIETNRMILVKILSMLEAGCDTAVNGQDAVEKFIASEPGEYDLILMDVQMPVVDGYTATRMIRDSDHPSAKTIPIIAMTANAFTEDVRDAINAGMSAHIAKPVQLNTLKSTIQQVMDSR